MVRTVSVSGSIGVGKTTLVAGLAKQLDNAFVVPENIGTLQFLPRFYVDARKYALHSRLEFLVWKTRQLAMVDETQEFAILDRSLPELITFARALVATGVMPQNEFELYEGIYEIIVSMARPIDLIIWTRAAPQVMLSRIADRGRPFEQGITREYLDSIDTEYENWFARLPAERKLVIDTTSLRPGDAIDMAAAWLRNAAR
ncbi:deoxynucleoside kinase [Jiella pelagia]|uniref:deoxynucleoside kinase n=1 Tax=Jiella pelagia TaxID=2986949 RepID=UPI002E307F36|nr:deoxynucleoside kinase [Jiella pelagia]